MTNLVGWNGKLWPWVISSLKHRRRATIHVYVSRLASRLSRWPSYYPTPLSVLQSVPWIESLFAALVSTLYHPRSKPEESFNVCLTFPWHLPVCSLDFPRDIFTYPNYQRRVRLWWPFLLALILNAHEFNTPSRSSKPHLYPLGRILHVGYIFEEETIM